jgi:hypothetical protein
MSESEFVRELRQERKQKQSELDDANRRLGPARRAQSEAHREYRASVESRGAYASASDRDHELNVAATAASQAVADLEQVVEHVTARVKEIDRLLTAADDARAARATLQDGESKIANTRATIAQLLDIETALQQELGELQEQRGKLLTEHGKADIAARIAGKKLPPPKALVAIDADHESRSATLAEVRANKAEQETILAALIEEQNAARDNLRGALTRRAELDYFEALPKILPIIGRLVAVRSGMAYSGQPNVFELRYSDDDVRAAAASIDDELRGEAA